MQITGFVGDTEPPEVFEQLADRATVKGFEEENCPFGRVVIYETETICPAGTYKISELGVVPIVILPLGKL